MGAVSSAEAEGLKMNTPLGLLTFRDDRIGASSIGEEDRLVAELAELGRNPNDRIAADLAARIMSRTTSARLRNAAVLALVDLDARSKVSDIVNLLRQPGIDCSAGTPLFALGELGGRLPLDVAVKLIAKGSFEARAETLTFMEEGRIDDTSDASAADALASLTRIAAGSDLEAAEAATLALAYLSDAL